MSITPPKYGSERVVHIPQALVEMIAAHIEKFGVSGAQHWLFVGQNGMPPHQNTIGYWWHKTAKEAGVFRSSAT